MVPAQTYRSLHDAYRAQVKQKSDVLMNYFLVSFFAGGLFLAFFYDTWLIAAGVGGLSLVAYYSAKLLLPDSDVYQYVVSTVFGIFMAQYIYQMHGLFEMHFIAFIGSAILITYQNWRLQIPLGLLILVHHATFGYLQYTGHEGVYFTQLDYMTLQTFVIHGFLTTIILFICGLWAYRLKLLNEHQIVQTFEMGRLQEEELQRKALQRYNEELRKSNKELDSFVYSVSHDLRAPLSSMLGIVNVCEMGSTDPFMAKNVGYLKTSIRKLDGFIMDILDYSRNSRMDVARHEIHFTDLLTDTLHHLKFMGLEEQRVVDVRTSVSNGVPFYSDKGRLTMILNNLISNSMRYHDPQTPEPFVEIRVKVSPTGADISVRDNGIGIGEEHQPKVFDMFYRATGKSIGSGLGLYIVREAVEKLNGAIELHSRVGQGTEFVLRIPNMTS